MTTWRCSNYLHDDEQYDDEIPPCQTHCSAGESVGDVWREISKRRIDSTRNVRDRLLFSSCCPNIGERDLDTCENKTGCSCWTRGKQRAMDDDHASCTTDSNEDSLEQQQSRCIPMLSSFAQQFRLFEDYHNRFAVLQSSSDREHHQFNEHDGPTPHASNTTFYHPPASRCNLSTTTTSTSVSSGASPPAVLRGMFDDDRAGSLISAVAAPLLSRFRRRLAGSFPPTDASGDNELSSQSNLCRSTLAEHALPTTTTTSTTSTTPASSTSLFDTFVEFQRRRDRRLFPLEEEDGPVVVIRSRDDSVEGRGEETRPNEDEDRRRTRRGLDNNNRSHRKRKSGRPKEINFSFDVEQQTVDVAARCNPESTNNTTINNNSAGADDACTCCLERQKQILLLPCGHYALCFTCTRLWFQIEKKKTDSEARSVAHSEARSEANSEANSVDGYEEPEIDDEEWDDESVDGSPADGSVSTRYCCIHCRQPVTGLVRVFPCK